MGVEIPVMIHVVLVDVREFDMLVPVQAHSNWSVDEQIEDCLYDVFGDVDLHWSYKV